METTANDKNEPRHDFSSGEAPSIEFIKARRLQYLLEVIATDLAVSGFFKQSVFADDRRVPFLRTALKLYADKGYVCSEVTSSSKYFRSLADGFGSEEELLTFSIDFPEEK